MFPLKYLGFFILIQKKDILNKGKEEGYTRRKMPKAYSFIGRVLGMGSLHKKDWFALLSKNFAALSGKSC